MFAPLPGMVAQRVKPGLPLVRRYWYFVIARPPSYRFVHVSVIDRRSPGLALSPGADGTSGVVALWLAAAERAVPDRIRSATV